LSDPSHRLTLLILAINGEEELARIVPELHDIAGELVIGIDDTTTDRTAEVARAFTDHVHPAPHEGFRGRGRPEDLNAVECMLPHCHGDWVLRVDQDETLSPLWQDRSYVSRLLEDRFTTHYWIPRRWVVPPGDRYISNRHWRPDYQLRLFRNIPSLVNFNRSPHAPPCVAGEARRLTDSWIIHWDYIWHDRGRREAKVDFYRQLCSYTAGEFYVYEGQTYATRPLADVVPEPSLAGGPRQSGAPHCASLEVLDYPEVMEAGKREPVLLGVGNCSNRLLCPSSVLVRPGNTCLSYHWFSADREIYRWDNERTELPKRLQPGEAAVSFLTVAAPEKPGNYLLQPDLVEEGVAWFSAHSSIPSYPVRVE
jgi:hypothetical protein